VWGRVQTTAHRLTGADAADPRQREARTHEEVMKDVVGSGTTPGDPDRGAARVSLCACGLPMPLAIALLAWGRTDEGAGVGRVVAISVKVGRVRLGEG